MLLICPKISNAYLFIYYWMDGVCSHLCGKIAISSFARTDFAARKSTETHSFDREDTN